MFLDLFSLFSIETLKDDFINNLLFNLASCLYSCLCTLHRIWIYKTIFNTQIVCITFSQIGFQILVQNLLEKHVQS